MRDLNLISMKSIQLKREKMTKIKYIVSYTDSKGMRQSKTTDTYTGARKVADYIKGKGGEARVSIFFDKSVKSV